MEQRFLQLSDVAEILLDAASVERFGILLARHRGGGRRGRYRDAPAAADDRCRDVADGRVRRVAALLGRELRLSLRHGTDTLAALLFFLLAGALFPLAIGPAPETLGRIAPGIVWVCALLAALLPLDRLFGADYEDGSLDQLLLTGLPASALAA